MTLSVFIRCNIDALTLAWESFARTCLPAARPLTSHDLRDHCAVMLRAFADDMETDQSASDQRGKSRGLMPLNAPAISAAAKDHALQRFTQGFTLNQMLRSTARCALPSPRSGWRNSNIQTLDR